MLRQLHIEDERGQAHIDIEAVRAKEPRQQIAQFRRKYVSTRQFLGNHRNASAV